MAVSQKISELPVLTLSDEGDLIAIVDVGDGVTKQITVVDLTSLAERTSPTRLAIVRNGEEIGYFRIDGTNAIFSLDSEGTAETVAPVFEVNERFSRPKVLMRSIIFNDPGDSAEIAIRHSTGTPASPEAAVAGQRNGIIYWQPRDDAGNYIPVVDPVNLPLAGTGPFYGRTAEISARLVESPTNLARGGCFLISTTKIGEVARRERQWTSHLGHFVIGGYGSYEARGTDTGGASTSVYPDTTAENFTPADGLERGVGTSFAGVQGAEDSFRTVGKAPLHHVMTDDVLGPFIAMREYNNIGDGLDWHWDNADDEVSIHRVQADVNTKIMTFKLSSGTIAIGENNVVRMTPVSSGVNGLDFVGAATGNQPQIKARGTDTDIAVRIVPKGNEGVELEGPLKFTATPQTLTGAGAVNIQEAITELVTTGTDALTLADGTQGQVKYVVMITDGGTGTLTPANLANGTTVTFDDVGDCAHFLFTNSDWYFMGGTATLA